MVKSRNSFLSWRIIVRFTLVPGSPRSCLTASLKVISSVLLPSIFMIRSPGFTPARYAGVSSKGVTMVNNPSFKVISIPNPPNSPSVSIFISRYSSGSRNWLWASRLFTTPRMAPRIRSCAEISFTYVFWTIAITSAKSSRLR